MTETLPSTRITGSVKLTSNGEAATTVKINILANSGGVCYPLFMGDQSEVVFDFAGMAHNAKIPIDYEHNQTIGYANRFDVINGQLMSSGVISLVDIGGIDVRALVQQIQDGVPWEASIEAWPEDDMSIEYIPEGVTTVVNQQTVSGPTFVLRKWTLKAIAICKFGADYGNTSVSIQLSDKTAKKAEKNKGYFIHLSNKKIMENETNKEVENVTAVEAAPVEAEAVQVDAVEAAAEAPEVTGATETQAEAVEAEPVEATASESETEATEAVEVEAAPVVAETVQASAKTVEATDSRKEYKAFKAKFADKAGEYFEAGYSLAEANDKFNAYLSAENAELKKRLAAIGSAGKQPVPFSDGSLRDNAKGAKASNRGDGIRIAGKKYEHD